MTTPPARIELPGYGLPLNHPVPAKYSLKRVTLPNALDSKDIYDGYIGNLLVHREILMLQIMNTISEKPDWDRKVFDEEITAKWRQEIAETGQDVTPTMIDGIIAEMRWKAKVLQEEGTFAVFDHVGVIRSDTAISKDLQQALRDAVAPLKDIPEEAKDYHPGSDNKVLDLVHPSLFPLVYGRTRILPDRTMTVANCLDHLGQGDVLPVPTDEGSKGQGRDPHWRWRSSDYKVYSQKFQWLPCDVEFSDHENCRIVSYINNLHPQRHQSLYAVVENVIARAIPQWNKSLTRTRQHENVRILYDRVEYLDRSTPEPRWESNREDEEGYEDDYQERSDAWWKARPIKLPEPRPTFVPPKVSYEGPMDLREKFRETGLQVIVKLANIELTPDKPTYEGGSWHIEGQLNERICATAIYYYDSANTTESRLAFRHRAQTIYDMGYQQDRHEFIHAVYGFGSDVDGYNDSEHFTQDLGSVVCNEGRLVTFPNTVQHRVAPFALADPTKPGHRKILALFLIDPHRRVISTANVPPQQAEWAGDQGALAQGLMTMEEAKAYRLELMEERSVFQDKQNGAFETGSFSLCEH
ncbi:hypothetical protein ASPACDRAFT_73958 [Aspergillus aculeatus ATCC 16872]|uniref:Uncharacterized protein n=1 Tax=Aspergillus aculeatus (strain ATCC 16872 / CBS 172.66 / WB 5094) TaxID=690307 RepID=A0A1L9X785_ASPA1|nr:uncharacterized protein ASPACDRAFT_73958 [Aspergillus aculeatus ATCC 16872]OJK04301.1 hypothetical protein ASPACDRAFT_73958 [Aspergillus aculeatus ATCC 16872]